MTIEMATTAEQWKTVEDNIVKEHAWYSRIKELCSSEVLNLRRMLPAGESKINHYNNIVNEAWQKATSINATYFIIASNWLPIFAFAKDFKLNKDIQITGSYTAGTYKGLPIIASPCLDPFEMICGALESTPTYDIENIDAGKFVVLKLED